MGKKKGFSYPEICDYVKQFGCELLEDNYIMARIPMRFKCACGNEFVTTLNTFRSRNKHQCNECTRKNTGHKVGRFTIDEIRKIVSAKGCKLISNDYESNKSVLEIECQCGKHFFTTFNKFCYRNKNKCDDCMSLQCGRSVHPLNYSQVKDYVESKGCKLISENYINSSSKMLFECKCGNIFERTLNKFKNGQTKCLKCINRTNHTYESVKNFIEKDSNSGCKLASSNYINGNEKLDIICKCGNHFYTNYRTFLDENKRCCDFCSNQIRALKKRKGIEYLRKYVEENSNATLLTSEYSNMSEPMRFRCECGNVFVTSFLCFKNGKKRCNICTPNSKMEEVAESFFIENGIRYIPQYSFNDLRSKYYERIKLHFDFAIFDDENNIKLLELDGEQHFRASWKFGGEEKLKRLQENDKRKDEYCFKKNIPLIRISYKQQKNLTKILEDLFL